MDDSANGLPLCFLVSLLQRQRWVLPCNCLVGVLPYSHYYVMRSFPMWLRQGEFFGVFLCGGSGLLARVTFLLLCAVMSFLTCFNFAIHESASLQWFTTRCAKQIILSFCRGEIQSHSCEWLNLGSEKGGISTAALVGTKVRIDACYDRGAPLFFPTLLLDLGAEDLSQKPIWRR